MMETRISQYAFAGMDEDTEAQLKEVCKRFARDMRFDFEYEYYSVYWEEESWTLANLAMPSIDVFLKKVH